MQKFFLFCCIVFSVRVHAQDIDVLHYTYMINLSDDNDTIKGLAAITFVQKINGTQISFDLTTVNANGSGMKVISVSADEQNTLPLHFSQSDQKFFIDIPVLKNGDTSSVVIIYQGVPDDGLIISKNKFGERTFFADNWPNRAHHWIPCNDRPDDKASFEFWIVAPKQYEVISNGSFVLSHKELAVEEQFKSEGKSLWHWKEDVPLSTKVMVIGAAKFATKTYNDSPKGLPISACVYPQDSSKGFSDFAVAPKIVKFFSEYIAPFPYNKLANVQSTTIFGGMENASCIFYDEKSITGNGSFEDVIAHEIAHQWFGDNATEKSFAHLWLSEGFATYMTNLYWEQTYGKEAMIERLKNDREEIIEFAKSSNHSVVDSTDNLMSLLNANSYQKGGWVLHMLRNEVGDTVFRQIIRTYYNQYKGGNAETRDFEAVAEKVSGEDLKWFFDQWLYQPGIPNLDLAWSYKNGNVELFFPSEHVSNEFNRLPLTFLFTYNGNVELFFPSEHVSNEFNRLPLTFLFTYKDGKTQKHMLRVSSAGHVVISIPSKLKPSKINLDPDVNLLFEGKISELK